MLRSYIFFQNLGLGGGPITGREYLSLLERHRPSLQWETNSAEHFFVYPDDQNVQHVVFYPSLLSIAKRLEEAHTWRAGISIWEIGQGLDYFFDRSIRMLDILQQCSGGIQHNA